MFSFTELKYRNVFRGTAAFLVLIVFLTGSALVAVPELAAEPISQADTASQSSLVGKVLHIEYLMPEAGDVVLAWGDGDWAPLPASMHPIGTQVIDGLAQTPMHREHGIFKITIPIPPATELRYGFLITKTRDGRPMNVWVKHPNRRVLAASAVAFLVILFGFLHYRRRQAIIHEWITRMPRALVRRTVFWFGGINLAFAGFTGLFLYLMRNAEHGWEVSAPIVKYGLMNLSLGSENTLATWYSSMLLLLVAAAAAICYVYDRYTREPQGYGGPDVGWLFLVGVFLLLSLDEMGSLHERIGGISSISPGGASRGWVKSLAVPIALFGILMIAFSYLRLRVERKALALVVVGTGLFLVNPVLELAELSIHGSSRAVSDRWLKDMYIAIQEATEIFGSLAWLLGLLIYLIPGAALLQADQEKARLAGADLQRIIVMLPILYVLVLLTTEVFVRFTLPEDAGIPGNWFPATLALLAYGAWWMQRAYIRHPDHDNASGVSNAGAPGFAFTLAISIAFGINLPGYLDSMSGVLGTRLMPLLVSSHIFFMFWLARKDKRLGVGLYSIVWALSIGTVLVVDAGMITISATAAYAVLLLSLTSWAAHQRPVPPFEAPTLLSESRAV